MGNIVDYVKNNSDKGFDKLPFAQEDALVLSEFCYLKFDGIVGGFDAEPMVVSDIDSHPDKESLFSVKAYEKDNRKLYNAILKSERFSHMKVGYYVNSVDTEAESQFAAVTFFLPNDSIFVAFRGTDETMAGWQEDFALALKKPIIGQTLSAGYLNKVAEMSMSELIVGGHSKGGNLAMYASLCASEETLRRITKIYSFDGPGFRPEFLSERDYSQIKDRIVHILPKSSPVGLLLNAPGEYEVIEAKSVGVLQHNIYNWIIRNNRLVCTKMSEQHLLAMRTMNEWLLSLDDNGIENFVSILCRILDATDASTTTEFKENVAQHTKALFEAQKAADDETKEMVDFFFKSYVEFAGDMVKEEVRKKYEEIASEVNLIKEKARTIKKSIESL